MIQIKERGQQLVFMVTSCHLTPRFAQTDLAYQASQRIMTATEPLKLLRDISHNFPSIANSLAKYEMHRLAKRERESQQIFWDLRQITN